MDNIPRNFGHNSKASEELSKEILKGKKKGFRLDFNKHGLKVDLYNTKFFRRIIRKSLIKLGLFQKLKTKKKELLVKYKLKQKINNIISDLTKNRLPLFDTISIETFSKCNGGCSFCPVNRFDDPRPDNLMDEELFKKIILNLYDLEYKGQLILSLNNEPFLDKRIYKFAEIARGYLPSAFISIWSNGTALNIDRFKKIIINLDELIIDNYNDDLTWHNNIQEIMEHLTQDKTHVNKVKFRMRFENDVLDTRAGQAKNRDFIKPLDVSCLYPFISINVQVNGDISLCCNDALSKEVVGSVVNKNLEEIWYSEKYYDYRKKINNSRKLVSICEGCDTVDIPKPSAN